MSKRKRSYGKGTARMRGANSAQLRFQGESKTVHALSQQEADAELEKWVREIRGAPPGTLTMSDLFDEYMVHLRCKGATDIVTPQRRIDGYLRPRLGMADARLFGKKEAIAYITSRQGDRTKQGEPFENATINRETAIISAALRLAADRLPRLVRIPKLREDNVRQGIVSEEVYRALLRELPDHAKLFWVFAYYTGVRKGELLKLRWEWMDWDSWLIRVPGWSNGERITKNGKTHFIPVFDEMRAFLEMAWAARDPAVPCVFQRRGACIKSFRTAFEEARERLGLPHILFHDTRRTAGTNLMRQGYSEWKARRVTGHISQAFRRYLIEEEDDARSLVEELEAKSEQKRQAAEKKYGQIVDNAAGPAIGPKLPADSKYKQ
jgi:integrase